MDFKHTYLYWQIQRKWRKRNIRKEGYSQYGQDVTVFDLLGRPSEGVFLDIGANDGITLSNSLLFEEKGWIGVCVEPHPTIFEKLVERRRCHLLNACVADEDRPVSFLVVEGEGDVHMASGIEEYLDERHLARIDEVITETGGSKRTIEIEALSPITLLRRFGLERVDYLSIDTEGCELAILKSFNFEETPVRLIGVENGSRSPELFRYLNTVGYRLVKCVGCDEIYERKERL